MNEEKPSLETHYGFKKLSKDNILEFDTWGISKSEDMEMFISIFIKPQLSDYVPNDIKALFEVARGAMIYGLFFYPLFTMGMEQLFRVCESALRQKAKQAGIKNRTIKFETLISKLSEGGIITSNNKEIWTYIRRLRNYSSHPMSQSIITPGIAIDTLNSVSNQINLLFSSDEVK